VLGSGTAARTMLSTAYRVEPLLTLSTLSSVSPTMLVGMIVAEVLELGVGRTQPAPGSPIIRST
jgi:hypothetical protein